MRRRYLMFGLCILFTAGFSACGGDSNNDEIASVEIVAPPDDLVPRETQQLMAVARNANGEVIDNVSFTWTSSNERFISVEPDATTLKNQDIGPSPFARIIGIYPATAILRATAVDGTFATISKLVVPPINNGQVVQLTNNGAGIEDNWGANNNWSTTSRDRILWVEDDTNTGEMTLILADTDNNQTPLQSGMDDIDFIGLGSDGFQTEGIMATWRLGLSNTFVDDGSATPDDLGAQTQEENAVADGCLFFREGLPNDDIWRFTFADGLDEIFTTGQSKGPVATSECQAVWMQEDGAFFDLMFYDGTDAVMIGDDLPFGASVSMRRGRVVFSQNNDIFLYDSTADNPQTVNITNSPGDLENFARTDGDSILIYRVENGITNQIILYDIATATEQIISTTTLPKNGETLRIDLKQAIWVEGTDLFFFDGESTSQVTLPVPLTFNMAAHPPYVADGTVTWVGNDGDDEIFIMK